MNTPAGTPTVLNARERLIATLKTHELLSPLVCIIVLCVMVVGFVVAAVVFGTAIVAIGGVLRWAFGEYTTGFLFGYVAYYFMWRPRGPSSHA